MRQLWRDPRLGPLQPLSQRVLLLEKVPEGVLAVPQGVLQEERLRRHDRTGRAKVCEVHPKTRESGRAQRRRSGTDRKGRKSNVGIQPRRSHAIDVWQRKSHRYPTQVQRRRSEEDGLERRGGSQGSKDRRSTREILECNRGPRHARHATGTVQVATKPILRGDLLQIANERESPPSEGGARTPKADHRGRRRKGPPWDTLCTHKAGHVHMDHSRWGARNHPPETVSKRIVRKRKNEC